jgi:hypothetical protein
LRQGTLYVRRSGANHIADARDLDAIIARRIEHFRTSLLEKIARVVESPVESEVIVVKQEAGSGPHKTFVIENAPEAMAVKGLTFSISPETAEQEIVAWIAMSAASRHELPSAGTVWKWYALRSGLQISTAQKLRVALFSLLRGVPAFYWFQESAEGDIKAVLIEALERRTDPELTANTLATSAFLGKRFYRSQVIRLGAYAKRLGNVSEFPKAGPRAYFEAALALKRGGKFARTQLENELAKITKSALDASDGQPSRAERWQAQRIDCFLYAQDEYGGGHKAETPDTHESDKPSATESTPAS